MSAESESDSASNSTGTSSSSSHEDAKMTKRGKTIALFTPEEYSLAYRRASTVLSRSSASKMKRHRMKTSRIQVFDDKNKNQGELTSKCTCIFLNFKLFSLPQYVLCILFMMMHFIS